jgi:hypothetical protein
MDTMPRYSHNTQAMVVTCWVVGCTHFHQNPDREMLGFLACFAIRDVLLDEFEGTERTSEELYEGLISRVQPPVPPEVAAAFEGFIRNEFANTLGAVRVQASQANVDLAELADALRYVQPIVRQSARRGK